jgi:hypothetical protein
LRGDAFGHRPCGEHGWAFPAIPCARPKPLHLFTPCSLRQLCTYPTSSRSAQRAGSDSDGAGQWVPCVCGRIDALRFHEDCFASMVHRVNKVPPSQDENPARRSRMNFQRNPSPSQPVSASVGVPWLVYVSTPVIPARRVMSIDSLSSATDVESLDGYILTGRKLKAV